MYYDVELREVRYVEIYPEIKHIVNGYKNSGPTIAIFIDGAIMIKRNINILHRGRSFGTVDLKEVKQEQKKKKNWISEDNDYCVFDDKNKLAFKEIYHGFFFKKESLSGPYNGGPIYVATHMKSEKSGKQFFVEELL